MFSARVSAGMDSATAFRRDRVGSRVRWRSPATSRRSPDRMFFALRGSGQALYVGVAEDVFVVASEPYGVVEECDRYLRMDGETPSNPQNPTASRGQTDRAHGGEAGSNSTASRRWPTTAPSCPRDRRAADRAGHHPRHRPWRGFPHFLLKEIGEAPARSARRCAARSSNGREACEVVLPDRACPRRRCATAWPAGTITKVLVIGQGTAAVAGQQPGGRASSDALPRRLT
jgi:glucosamine--fructose-6-phosphate aminotransferase (isomerizing)